MTPDDVTGVFFNALAILLAISFVAGGFWYLIAKGLNRDEKTIYDAVE